jgi:hypothetical protein
MVANPRLVQLGRTSSSHRPHEPGRAIRRHSCSLFVWLVADGWCWFVLREKYCWLVAGGWFVLREKYYWLVADKPSEQAVDSECQTPYHWIITWPYVVMYLCLLTIISLVYELLYKLLLLYPYSYYLLFAFVLYVISIHIICIKNKKMKTQPRRLPQPPFETTVQRYSVDFQRRQDPTNVW